MISLYHYSKSDTNRGDFMQNTIMSWGDIWGKTNKGRKMFRNALKAG